MSPSSNAPLAYTNLWTTGQLAVMSLMCSVAALLSFVQIPIMPAAPFLTYDPSLVPAMICGFAFGPAAGCAVGAMTAVIHGMLLGEWVGSIMNIVATFCFIAPAALVYRRMHTFAGAASGLVVASLGATAASIAANLTIGVAFWYGSVDAIAPMIAPVLVPFNLVKFTLDAVLVMLAYKSVSNLITPKKRRVEGRRARARA
ncbi:MAG: ECF transporter S component [Slackia sp.]|nr:ECF transporter S component [Slackia sp.]